ncbi:drug efflux ABC transporter ATP-binding protein/permease [Streptococcus troglodytae]|uniref:Drug efflux ABC transporter ATP-binding protein/permease n=1 Tax=Streptococcus troglodytae TaxID=1111760 RepID=A0A1L7LM62_9STRE|nr:ATP-binding cassette domain-containing protein [Streptococcus troglodytae]BAQ25210.1 drug efflux ABC transporter ATP-binding protein/permease [Streptococcus troglodytae]
MTNVQSTVDQSPYIFDTTVRNNITLFQNDNFDESILIDILKKVNLYDEFLSNGLLEYQCGDNGCNLSGGQKQKIALARALIRKYKIYLLDEISANLDHKNSQQLHNLLFNLNISFIEISHHFDMKDSRYTAVYRLNRTGNLEK